MARVNLKHGMVVSISVVINVQNCVPEPEIVYDWRISDHIPKDKLIHVANNIWMSKMRYGLQLTHKVRVKERRTGRQKT